MKFDIVVAHYTENLNWIRSLTHPSIRKVFVYTKGPAVVDLSSDAVSHSYLPNVGRESHTYLWHSVHNFHEIANGKMADFIFFVQGSPHSMNAAKISEWIEEVDRSGLSFTLNYRISSAFDFLSSGRCRSWAGATSPSECDVGEWCERYVKNKAELRRMPVFWNACFGVSSERIVHSGRERMARIQQAELATTNPECGHFCERLWYYIFSMDSAPKNTVGADIWDFYGGRDGNSHYGTMRLRDDGKIGLYDNFNERSWRMEDESIVLIDDRGTATSRLARNSDHEYSGSFLGRGGSSHRIVRHAPMFE